MKRFNTKTFENNSLDKLEKEINEFLNQTPAYAAMNISISTGNESGDIFYTAILLFSYQ